MAISKNIQKKDMGKRKMRNPFNKTTKLNNKRCDFLTLRPTIIFLNRIPTVIVIEKKIRKNITLLQIINMALHDHLQMVRKCTWLNYDSTEEKKNF